MKTSSFKALILSIACLLSGYACTNRDSSRSPDNGVDSPNLKLVTLTKQPNYVVKYHLGTNVHAMCESNSVKSGGKLGSAYSGIPFPEDTNSWNKIFDHMNWFGFNWIRLGYEHNDIQPEKGKYTWQHPDQPSEITQNYLNMLHFLDWAQENNVHVMLQEFAQATEWNSIPGQEVGHSAPNDLEAWADGYVELVKHLVNDKGYSCIKMLNISNEPENWWGWWNGRKIAEGYKIVRQKLDAEGIDIPLAGPEYMSDGSYTLNWEECKPYIGIFETHNYDDSHKNTIAFRPIPDPEYPIIWGEYAGADNRDYEWNLWVAKWQVGGYNNGVDGFARWNFLNTNDIDGNFSYIITWDTFNDTLLKGDFPKQPNLYHIDGLISRFVARESAVLTTHSPDEDIIPCAFRSPNGNYTMIVVSQLEEDKSVDFTLQDIDENITLYKYEINLSHKNLSDINLKTRSKFRLKPDSDTFTDTVKPWSLIVYSTFNLEMKDNGVVEDGVYTSTDTVLIPLSDNPVIIDETHDYIELSSDFSVKHSPECYNGALAYTNEQGAYYEFSFRGTGFRLYGQQDNGSGLSSVYINDEFVGYASNYAPVLKSNTMIYESIALPLDTYRVRVVNEGIETVTSLNTYINIDAIALTSPDATLLH